MLRRRVAVCMRLDDNRYRYDDVCLRRMRTAMTMIVDDTARHRRAAHRCHYRGHKFHLNLPLAISPSFIDD
jgi:hypothetical protein